MLVCPTATPIRYARLDVRTTALAILGSATSTSLVSRGRSITTDLPIPSWTKREDESEPTTRIGAPLGAATPGGIAAGSLASNGCAVPRQARTASVTRVDFHVDILLIPH